MCDYDYKVTFTLSSVKESRAAVELALRELLWMSNHGDTEFFDPHGVCITMREAVEALTDSKHSTAEEVIDFLLQNLDSEFVIEDWFVYFERSTLLLERLDEANRLDLVEGLLKRLLEHESRDFCDVASTLCSQVEFGEELEWIAERLHESDYKASVEEWLKLITLKRKLG